MHMSVHLHVQRHDGSIVHPYTTTNTCNGGDVDRFNTATTVPSLENNPRIQPTMRKIHGATTGTLAPACVLYVCKVHRLRTAARTVHTCSKHSPGQRHMIEIGVKRRGQCRQPAHIWLHTVVYRFASVGTAAMLHIIGSPL